ncbi:MAG TPA: GAF domain-containing SpoIIE family protein phosphatase, partial [Candidatus Angelobacter sp.]
LIWTKMRSAVSPDAKRRLHLLTLGSIIGLGPYLVLRALSAIMSVDIEVYFPEWLWFTAYLLYYLFPLVLAWVIVVHRAMDVRVVLRQGVQYALARNGVRVIQLSATVAIFFAAVTLVSDGGRNRIEKIALIVSGLGALIFIQRGSDRLRNWIDRRFFREDYNAEQMLSELGDQVRLMIEPGPLLQTVVARLSETLHIARIAVLLDAGSPYRLAYVIGYGAVSDLTFTPQSATVRTLQANKQPMRVYLEDQDSWIYREAGEEERLQLLRLQPALLLPLTVRDKLLGFLSLGAKRSEEPYSGNDLKLLKSVATQTGLALENAQLMAVVTEEVAQRERMNREVEIAREVQERLFPQQLPAIAGLDFTGACRPALGVGGDYYDFLELPDGHLGIALGDVSGKGIGAALLMASLQASLRAEASRAPQDLAGLVGSLNRLVYQSSTSNRYATFFYAQYDPGKRLFTYVNAGHNPPMLFRKNGAGQEILRLTTGGTVVGLLESFPYQQESLQLVPGDVLVAFTDGISEAMNPSDEEWGEERLMETLQAGAELPAKELLSKILEAADGFAAGARQHDDMTLVILRVV